MPARIRSYAGATHPGPALAVTAITVLLGVAGALDGWRVALLGCAMLADQLSVGLSNDWIDADRDRASGRADKPVARGDVPPRSARNLAFALAALALLLTVPLGWAALALHTGLLATAWAYNAWLKSTVLSPLPYVVCFGLLPALVTLAADAPHWPSGWVVAAGALLGLAAHFANVLPDLDADRRTGVVGLGHRMGMRASASIAFLALASASAALAAELGFGPLALAGLTAGAAIAGLGLVLALRGRGTRTLFRLVILGALVDGALLVLAA
ncbi:UbiA family prenyltransferase [Protaetiibacter larvae]|uniref:1,4-dihydroxy-2-naphthoate prenyltransferase n=1 Tax=Protaetiibacter larvae TaxID=2592654 RepID=A0A5C1Y7N3_9MICO|nr:UbiA family prenyltransferase [Protaetiibacter larvae]QEO09776.1 1,4-dihydroxy-2-naphthoate prenyltransferase [Protaetiibacter larvae]